MAGISDTFVTETIECFENFPLHDLDSNWIQNLWLNQFSTLEDYPLSEDNDVFGEGLFEPISNAIVICEKWAEEEPEKSLSCTENPDDSTSNSKVLWTILTENDIETKYILGFVYAVCNMSIKNDAPLFKKEMGIKCAKLYLIMLRVPGSAAYSIFHPSILRLAFDCFKFPKEKIPGRKRPPTSAFRNDVVSQRKRIRREDENFEEVEPAVKNYAPNETEFGQKECDEILDALSDLLTSVILLFQSFSLSSNVELQEHVIDKLCECVALEINHSDFNFNRSVKEILEFKRRKGTTYVLSGLAYCALLNLCQPLHGDVESIYMYIFQALCGHILCLKAKSLPTSTIPHKYLVIKDNAVDFVCYNLQNHPEKCIKCTRVLIQKLCSRCCDKTIFREKTAMVISKILKYFPLESYVKLIEWLTRFATQKPPDKVMSLDVISLLIMEPTRKVTRNITKNWLIYATHIPFVHTVITRCYDKAPTVRAKALNVLTTSLKIILNIIQMDPNDYLPQYIENEDVDCVTNENVETETSKQSHNKDDDDCDEDYVAEQEPVASKIRQPHQNFNICNIETLLDLLLTRAADFKVHVRKAALQAIQQLLLLEEIYITEKFLNFFDYGTRDANITVRRTAVECLSKLLKQYNSNYLIQKFWLNNVLPTALDAEKSVQAKALEEMEPLFLADSRNSAIMKKCSWVMLNGIACGDFQDLFLYLKKAFSIWKAEGKLKPNLGRCLEAEFGTINEPAAWMLLDILSSQIEIKNMSSILKAWEASKTKEVSTSTHISMLCVISHGCKYMKNDQLKYLQEYFENTLRNFTCHHRLIPNTSVTLLKTFKAQYKNEETLWRNVHHFTSEVIQLSEKFLTDYISDKTFSRDLYPENLVCQHLTTIGELVLIDPHQATDKLCLILQSIIVSSSTGNNNIICNDDNFESWKYSPKIQSFACLSLGKLCLMNEDIAKKCIAVFNRELSTSKHSEVRITIVTVFSDLCVRYTLMVDRYIPSISSCLKDEDPKVRLHTLAFLSRLLQEDYIKLKESLLCRLLVTITDTMPSIRSMAEYCLGNLLVKRHPTLFIQHFVECIFYLNCSEEIPGFKFNQKELDIKLFSLKGKRNMEKRLIIYNFMIKYTPSIRRIQIILKLSADLLQAVATNAMPLNKTTETIVKDCFAILSSEELKPNKSQESADDTGEETTEPGEDKISKNAHKVSVICGVIPVLMSLKKYLTELKSPLVSDLLHFLTDICKDYKNEVKDVLASDKQLAQEIEYEIKKYEKEQEKKKNSSVQDNDEDGEISEENTQKTNVQPSVATAVSSLRNRLHNVSLAENLAQSSKDDQLISDALTKNPVVVLNRLSSLSNNNQNNEETEITNNRKATRTSGMERSVRSKPGSTRTTKGILPNDISEE